MGSKETQAILTGHTSNIMLLLLLIAVSVSSSQAEKLLAQCTDVAGRPHKINDSYIGPDNCNDCKCKEAGSACTKKVCPADATARNAEAGKCVDKDGILHEEGESFTHVDGCNDCRCTEHGGACTKKLCIKTAACVDTAGKERTVGDSGWSSATNVSVDPWDLFVPKCSVEITGARTTEAPLLTSQETNPAEIIIMKVATRAIPGSLRTVAISALVKVTAVFPPVARWDAGREGPVLNLSMQTAALPALGLI